jgi:pantoate--beta-alanine ligase
MQILKTIESLQSALGDAANGTLGFVPTMGNLHAGHLSLVARARADHDLVVVSIFVNPLQFGANEDLDAYPRTLDADSAALIDAGCDVLFLPSAEELYGDDMLKSTRVQVPELGADYCGASRPGHFDGVTTVVAKLFNIVQPDAAYFGLKDYQQFSIIRKMVSDLAMPVALHGVDTVREASGLALSSRNGYLTPEQKSLAPLLYQTIKSIGEAIAAGEQDFKRLTQAGKQQLQEAGFQLDYLAIANAASLRTATKEDSHLVILVAAYLGSTRLIDNLRIFV